MKILHMHPTLAGGGIEAMICGLCNEMICAHNVTICTIFEPKETDVFEKKIDKRIRRASLGKTTPGFSLIEIYKIYRFIKEGHYDVVHIHGFFYYYAFAIALLHNRVKFYYTIHSDAKMENSYWDSKIIWLKTKFFRRNYIRPITISEASQKSFYELYGVNSFLIHNGVPKPTGKEIAPIVQKQRKTNNTLVFLHPGRINRAKNQVALCEVFDRLIKEQEDVVLLIAGGNYDNHIYAKISTFFSEKIIYLGERSDITALLSASDAMCLPSIWEGLPVTLLEALSVGCIPICSPVGGIVNVIEHRKNGLLSTDSSVDAYYNAIKEFIALPKEKKIAMKTQCLHTFERFDIANVAAEYLRVYTM